MYSACFSSESILVLMALQHTLGPWSHFQFFIPVHSLLLHRLLGRGSARRGVATYTGDWFNFPSGQWIFNFSTVDIAIGCGLGGRGVGVRVPVNYRTELCGLSRLANYTDRATAACRRS
jgi:hypothetical protein